MKQDEIYKILFYIVSVVVGLYLVYKIYQWYFEDATKENFTGAIGVQADSYVRNMNTPKYLWVINADIGGTVGNPYSMNIYNIGRGGGTLSTNQLNIVNNNDIIKTQVSTTVSQIVIGGSFLELKQPINIIASIDSNNNVYESEPQGVGFNNLNIKGKKIVAGYQRYYLLGLNNDLYSGIFGNQPYFIKCNSPSTTIVDIAVGKYNIWVHDGASIWVNTVSDTFAGTQWTKIPTPVGAPNSPMPTMPVMSVSNSYGWLLNTDRNLYYLKADGSATSFTKFDFGSTPILISKIATTKDMCVAVSDPQFNQSIYICSKSGNKVQIPISSNITQNGTITEIAIGYRIIALIISDNANNGRKYVYALNMSVANSATNNWIQITGGTTNARNLIIQQDWSDGWFSNMHISFNPDARPILYNSGISGVQYISVFKPHTNDYLGISELEVFDDFGDNIIQDPTLTITINNDPWQSRKWPNNSRINDIQNVIDGYHTPTYLSGIYDTANTSLPHPFASICIKLSAPRTVSKIRFWNRMDGRQFTSNGIQFILRDTNRNVLYNTNYSDAINDIFINPASNTAPNSSFVWDGCYQDFLMPSLELDSGVVGRYISFISTIKDPNIPNGGGMFSLNYVEVQDTTGNIITIPSTSVSMLNKNNTSIPSWENSPISNLVKDRDNKAIGNAMTGDDNQFNRFLIDLGSEINIKQIKIYTRTDWWLGYWDNAKKIWVPYSKGNEFWSTYKSNAFYTVVQNEQKQITFMNSGFNINDNVNRYDDTFNIQKNNQQYQILLTNKLLYPIKANRLFVNIPENYGYDLAISRIEIFDDVVNKIYTVSEINVKPVSYDINAILNIGCNSGFLRFLDSNGNPVNDNINVCRIKIYSRNSATPPNKAIFSLYGLDYYKNNDSVSRYSFVYASEAIPLNRNNEQEFIICYPPPLTEPPIILPTSLPTSLPIAEPTIAPTIAEPTIAPTIVEPTIAPTIVAPTIAPTIAPVPTMITPINFNSAVNLNASYLQSATDTIKYASDSSNAVVLEPFQNQKSPVSASINQSLSSAYNAQQISVIPSNDGTYKLQVNGECITVYGDKDYSLKKCDAKTYAQAFKFYDITNPLDSQAITGQTVDPMYDSAIYPYSLVSSSISNNCLTIDNDGISISPCVANKQGQQWNISSTPNYCIPNEK